MKSIPRLLCLVACLWAPIASAQPTASAIIPRRVARVHGFERAWVAQLRIDRTRDRIRDVVVDGDLVLVLSQRSVVEAIEAETGRSRWRVQIGDPSFPTVAPGAGADLVAVANGVTLYVLDRLTGEILFDLPMGATATAPPAIAGTWIFVPVSSPKIAAFNIDDNEDLRPEEQAWSFKAKGTITAPPIITSQGLAWASSGGVVYAGESYRLGVRFQMVTNGEIRGSVAARNPAIYAASRDRFVYSIDEMDGRVRWKFSAGDPISHRPIILGDELFVITETGGMFSLSAEIGTQRWWTPYVARFLAASPDYLYTADDLGRVLVIDRMTGGEVDQFEFARPIDLLASNYVNDRLYLGTRTGLLQCLHELGHAEPVFHREEEFELEGDPAGEPPADEGADPADDPAAEPADPPVEEDDPFADEDDPFAP